MEEKPFQSLPPGAEKFGSPSPMAIAGIILVCGLLIVGYCRVRFLRVSRALRRGENATAQMLRNINLGGGSSPNEVGLLDSTIVNAQTTARSSYLLGEIKTVPRTATSPARYSITAFPAVSTGSGRTGNDCYFIDDTGMIRHSGRPDVQATATSSPIGN